MFLINTLLLHIPLLAFTDGQNDRQRNKYTRCMWAGGTFFQLCCCVSFLVVARNSFRCYLSTIPVVPLCLFFGCGRKLFWFAQISFLIVVGNSFRCCLLTYHTSCAIVSFFWLRREIVFGCTV